MEPSDSDKPQQKSPFSNLAKKKTTDDKSPLSTEKKPTLSPLPLKPAVVEEKKPEAIHDKELFEDFGTPEPKPAPSFSTSPPTIEKKPAITINESKISLDKPLTPESNDVFNDKIPEAPKIPGIKPSIPSIPKFTLPESKPVELKPLVTPESSPEPNPEPNPESKPPIEPEPEPFKSSSTVMETKPIATSSSRPMPPVIEPEPELKKEPEPAPIQKPIPPLINHNFMMIIPSWQQITGAPLGKYIHNKVSMIESDPLIFFGGKEVAIETPKGKVYLIFGLGYYFVKFQMADKKYVIDNRLVTGLVLSDFIYDLLASSRRNTLEDDPDVIISEKLIKIPWGLSRKTDQKLAFIKGALMRELMRFKEIIMEMMDKIKNNTLQFGNRGHRILTTHWDMFNCLLYEDQLKQSDASYLLSMAGINGIKPGAKNHIASLIGDSNLDQIGQCINLFQNTLMSTVVDPMDLYSILNNSFKTIRVQNAMGNVEKYLKTGSQIKHTVLYSADPWRNQMAEWPTSIPRTSQTGTIIKAGAQPDIKQLVKEYHKTLDSMGNVDASQLTVSKVDGARESFQFSHLSQTAGARSAGADPSPEGDTEAILRYLKEIVNADFDLPTIGAVFDAARENLRKIDKQSQYLWQLSKISTKYGTKAKGLGLSEKEKEDLNVLLDKWIAEVVEAKRIEAERLERERLERERIERERLEAERLEQERLERERLEQERLAKLEEDRKEREKQEFIAKKKAEQQELQRQQEEKLRIEREAQLKSETDRKAKEEALRIQQEKERLAAEKVNLKQVAADRKKQEKEAKERAKQEQKLKKEQEKLEKQRKKEEEKKKKEEEKRKKEEEKKAKALAKAKK